MKKLLLILLFFYTKTICALYGQANATHSTWKAGVARVVITPDQPIWLAGYGARTRPSEGVLHDIWAKALVMEDAAGKRAVIVTTDLLGFPKEISDKIRSRLQTKFKLSRAQILLNSSHTHSAPVLQNALSDVYPLDAAQIKKVEQYSREFEDKIINLVGAAITGLQPVRLYAQNGVTRFQVNRRNNKEADLNKQTELKGPNDFAVPVIKVVNNTGKLLAVAFGYACHPTVLDGYQVSGDYVGFAQLELEKAHPGVTALFFQGAGADQNPIPRRSLPLAQQYGRTLAAAVERVLEEEMRPLTSQLITTYSEIPLPLSPAPSAEQFAKMAQEYTGYQKRWAERMLGKSQRGEKFLTAYPYPLQVWRLGDQPIFSLGGELVIEYAIELKRLFGPHIFVLGYSNDVMSYIPSSKVWQEGGYEGESAQMVYGLPAKWGPNIETLILEEMKRLAAQAQVPAVKL